MTTSQAYEHLRESDCIKMLQSIPVNQLDPRYQCSLPFGQCVVRHFHPTYCPRCDLPMRVIRHICQHLAVRIDKCTNCGADQQEVERGPLYHLISAD